MTERQKKHLNNVQGALGQIDADRQLTKSQYRAVLEELQVDIEARIGAIDEEAPEMD